MRGEPTINRLGLSQEAFYRLAVDSAFDWEEWLTTDGSYAYISPSCTRVTGLRPQALMVRPERRLEVVHLQDRENYRQHILKMLEGPVEPGQLNYRLLHMDGSQRWIEQIYQPVFTSEGRWLGHHLANRDLTFYRKAIDELEQNFQGLREMLDNPTDIALLVEPDGKILMANETLAQIFGLSAEGLENRWAWDLLSPEQTNFLKPLVERVCQTGQPERAEDQTQVGYRYDSLIIPIRDQDGQVVKIGILARDVTEHWLAQQAVVAARDELEKRVKERTAELEKTNQALRQEIFLRYETEQQLQTSIAQANAMVLMAERLNEHNDLQDVLQAISDETIRATGYPTSSVSLYDEGLDALVIAASSGEEADKALQTPPMSRAAYEGILSTLGGKIIIPDQRALSASMRTFIITRPNLRTMISLPLMHQGELIGALNVASIDRIRIPSSGELKLLGALAEQAAITITKAHLFKQVSEDQHRLHMLTERLVQIQETERRGLAHQLHEDIGQSLTSLTLHLDRIERAIQQAPEQLQLVQSGLQNARQQIAELLGRIRDLSLDLRPALLDDLGLLPALDSYFERYTTQTGIQVIFKHSGMEQRYPEPLEIAIYRIIQESLANVRQHAQVQETTVRLWATTAHLGLQIEDQGIGFDPQTVLNARESKGIAEMVERAAACNGRLEIESYPDKGTCLSAEFPMAR